LGPRTELEIRQSLLREVEQERWTSLDVELQERTELGLVDLTDTVGEPLQPSRRSLLIGRLQRLQDMGLARELGGGQWQLGVGFERSLCSLGERGDIVRTMQRAFTAGQ